MVMLRGSGNQLPARLPMSIREIRFQRSPLKSIIVAAVLAAGAALLPALAQTPPSMTIGPAEGMGFKLTWPSLPEKSYGVWESPDLLSWTPVSGFPRWGTGVEMEYRFVPGAGARYFRVRSEHVAPDGFVLIPGGSFQMGDPSASLVGLAPERPLHTVHVDSFYIGKYEVTWVLWDAVRRWGDTHGYAGVLVGSSKGPDHPVFNIAWTDMVKWCNARSEMEGLTPCYYYNGQVMKQGEGPPVWDRGANGYRLPTEAEWEKAARGGNSGTNYHWGDTINHSNANFQSYGSFSYDLTPAPRGHHPDYDLDPKPYTAPAGSFPPNAYGLFDMAGNVDERCWDLYSAVYYTDPGATVENTAGPTVGSSRLIRGGSWEAPAREVRCSARQYAIPGARSADTGFRLARNVSPIPAGFTLIPAGTFEMGDQSNPPLGIPVELPVHTVTTNAYLIAKHELSGAEWESVRTWGLAHGYTDLQAGSAKSPNHPVQNITWFAAVKWCNARSEKEGLTPCYTINGQPFRTGTGAPDCLWTASGYRLPTEAEWERAARGGRTAKLFPWGDTITHPQANYISLADLPYDISSTRGYHPSFSYGGSPYTAPLGSFSANDYALADTAGNVREWCWDWADVNYYAVSPSLNPRGPAFGTQRAARGGSWASDALQCRSSSRAGFGPSDDFYDTGLRLARSWNQ